jgi:hypothetical protein
MKIQKVYYALKEISTGLLIRTALNSRNSYYYLTTDLTDSKDRSNPVWMVDNSMYYKKTYQWKNYYGSNIRRGCKRI